MKSKLSTNKLSQLTDTSDTKTTLKCCYALCCSLETIFSHDKLLAQQISPSRNGDKSSKGGVWLPMWQVNKNGQTHSLTLCNALFVLFNIQLNIYWVTPSMFTCVMLKQLISTGLKQVKWKVRDGRIFDLNFFCSLQFLCKFQQTHYHRSGWNNSPLLLELKSAVMQGIYDIYVIYSTAYI